MLEADETVRKRVHAARRIDLLVALSTSDLRARYGRGAWKSLKWLLDPFFATGVYLILVTEAVAFASALLLLAGMMAAYGVAPTAAVLWLPVVLAVTFLFSLSVAYPASLMGVWYSELRTFAISVVRTLFFLAPGLVALDQVPEGAQKWLKLNPLTGIFESYRSVLLYGTSPAPWEILYPTAFALALLAVVVPLYRSEQRQFAKLVDS